MTANAERRLPPREWWIDAILDVAFGNVSAATRRVAKLLAEPSLQAAFVGAYEKAFNLALENAPKTISTPTSMKRDLSLHSFDPSFPAAHPLFAALLAQAERELKAESLTGERVLALRSVFGSRFAEVVQNESKYARLKEFCERCADHFDTPEGKAVSHLHDILRSTRESPLPIDPELRLWDIYIAPTARVNHFPEYEYISQQDNVINYLLATIENSDEPIVLHGQPGHGKSSAVKILACALVARAEVLERKDLPIVLLYEFKQLTDLHRNELDILRDRTPFVDGESFFHNKHSVVILDGLDERQITDGTDSALFQFVRNLFQLASRVNKQDGGRFNLILTGRSEFVRQISPAFCGPHWVVEIDDFDDALVDRWLAQFATLKRMQRALTHKDLSNRGLSELMHQPILLTISTRLLTDREGIELVQQIRESAYTRGAIYRTIIRWTFMKKWHEAPAIDARWTESTYNELLQLIALLMFREGTEAIRVSSLERQLAEIQNRFGLVPSLDTTRDGFGALCRDFAVSFFFEGIREQTFAFIHKSIKDSLVVDSLFEQLAQITASFDESRSSVSCRRIADGVYWILGHATLSHEDHLPFIRDYIRAYSKRCKKLFAPLRHMFSNVLSHEYVGHATATGNPRVLDVEANVLSNLLLLLAEIYDGGAVYDNDRSSEAQWRPFDDEFGLYQFASFLNAVGHDRFATSRFRFEGMDLSGMRCANMSFCGGWPGNIPSHYDISRGKIQNNGRVNIARYEYQHYRTTIYHIAVVGANLKKATLSGGDFHGANLAGADLQGANLSGADFRGANLRGADLRGANLDETDLQGALIEGALSDRRLGVSPASESALENQMKRRST